MLQTFFKNWWAWVLRGAIAIIFGILALANPGAMAATLLFWLAVFLVIDGGISLITVFSTWKQREDKWLLVLEGALSLVLGFLIMRNPGATMALAVMYLGIWAIFSGAVRIAMAIQLRKEIEGEGWLILGGALTILFGLLIIAQPGIAVASLMYMVGIFAVLLGGVLIALGFKVRKVGKRIKEKAGELREGIEGVRASR